MKEFKSILKELENLDLSTRRAAIATVVQVRGSSYRSPGARMLITDDGRWVGSISGGCLEGDALRQARQVMTDKLPQTVTYDTREGSNQNLGISLGCNGIIDVLIEPVDITDGLHTVDTYKSLVGSESPVAMATVFGGPKTEISKKLLYREDGGIVSSIGNRRLQDQLVNDLELLLHERTSQARDYAVEGIEYRVFLELIQPSVSLIIFGGGFDARPVSSLAKKLGWDVTVTDECVAHIAPLFFPTADKLSLCQRTYIDRDFRITANTACVLMSHNYEYDRDVLKKLLSTGTPFIGILGPRKRFDKMLEEFSNEGISINPDDFERIHSPVGLDIGAEAADEIAVSIIAEIQSKFANREGGSLKYRSGPIHDRDSTSDQVFKQLYIN
ncbi:XdhC/CoxI family protein [Chryseolinea sp. T2]|uniref:XdhC family protein n=1 Tax=Chryseolinea sp. T2 TaxID=3129255 RepID=UPI0030787ABD